MSFEPVIGLEVHAQLLTNSKIFCSCRAQFGLPPNSATCPVCLGLPGSLPVLNRSAVEMAMMTILAVGGRINDSSVFARKNYFYPDLPKGYQISQYEQPIGSGGAVEIRKEGKSKLVRLNRIHLEEDAGKSLHPESSGDDFSRVDLNRCGTPLIEIVSEADIHSPREAYLYLHALKQILEYLAVCDGNMEQGSLRCDANVSVRPVGTETYGTRTEVKNMNSIRGVEKALAFEINRQMSILESGGVVVQETLLYNDSDGKCYPMRSKEESHDYRYFPDPDLVRLEVDESWRQKVQALILELPLPRERRFVEQYELPEYDAEVLTSTRHLADYFEEVVRRCDDPKLASNWVMTELLARLKDTVEDIRSFPISAERLSALLVLMKSGEITGKMAKDLFDRMLTDLRPPGTIMSEYGLKPISDPVELERLIDEIIEAHPSEVARFRAGKTKLMGFFVGMVMKATAGKADPTIVNELLNRKLAG